LYTLSQLQSLIACFAPWHRRIANFERVIGRPSYITIQDGWPFGYWFMGNDHSRDADYHGAYPGDYARRFRALFFDKQRALHLFSGRVNLEQFPGDTLNINPELRPTWCIDVHKSQGVVPYHSYNLVLADPPYTKEDAEHYGTPIIKRQAVFQILTKTMAPAAHLVSRPDAVGALERPLETRMPNRNRLLNQPPHPLRNHLPKALTFSEKRLLSGFLILTEFDGD